MTEENALPEPNKKFLDGVTPTIQWAEKTWPIPLLAPRQQRLIIPALMRSGRALTQGFKLGADPLTTEELDDLYLIVFWGLKRAHQDLTRDQFDDVALSIEDLIPAVGTVSMQTGVMKKGDGNKAPVGEAPNPLIGT